MSLSAFGLNRTYWVGEAMQKTDYKDLAETPENA